MEKFESERNTLFSVILGHTLNVILGFIPRIHTEHFSLLDTRDTPEYDNRKNFTKDLDVVRQCAALLEQLKTHIKIPPLFCHPRAWLLARPEDLDSRNKSENDNPWNFTKGLDVVRECAGIFKRRVQKEYTSAKISSRHQLNEFSQNNLRPQCAPDTTGFLSDVYKRGTRARKFLVDGVQCGRSMIEMLGVLAIIGVLSIGGIAGYTKAMEKIHVNKIVNMISDISATIKTAYISQKAYDDFDAGLIYDDAPQIQDMGLLPPEYIFEFEGEKMIGLSSPLTLINPVGDGETGYSALSIGVLVPQNLCVPLLTYDWRNADMKGVFTSMDLSDPDYLGGNIFFVHYYIDNVEDLNCDENQDDGYFCIETEKQRFRPVSPAVAAKYCESSAADAFGTGQMYVGFDLLADIKVPVKH